MWKCRGCGEEIEDTFDMCWNCQTGRVRSSPESNPAPPEESVRVEKKVRAKSSSEVASLMKRYTDAYLVARATNGFGILIKVIGIVIGILLALIGFMVASQSGPRDPMSILGIIGIAFGVFTGALFYIIGVLVSAQGQILKASLDSAVNTSPFLTNEDRAKVMSL
jgi:heme/copper-type cytochrome/quinol oxidase subunit 4